MSGLPSGAATLTYDHCEAALCIWEWALEQKYAGNEIPWMHEFEGCATHRAQCIDLAPAMEIAYRHAVDNRDYDSCFDWDFVPAIMQAITDPEAFKANPTALADEILEEATEEVS